MVRGRSRHILGYLQDFLFEPKRARTPVKALSGARKPSTVGQTLPQAQ